MTEHAYPVDRLTGLPYCVVPYETSNFVDTNHLAFHSDNSLLQGTGGSAVRFARVQEMDRDEHQFLHGRYGSMQKLPENLDEQFEYCVWAALGDIPPNAVDLSRRTPWVVSLDSRQIDILRRRDVRIDSSPLLGKFFSHYIRQQSLHFIDETDIGRYLYTPFKSPKTHKGQWLLREAAEAAVEPLQTKYRQLIRSGRVATKPHIKLADVVIAKIGKYQREEFVKKKRNELTSAQVSWMGRQALQVELDKVQVAA